MKIYKERNYIQFHIKESASDQLEKHTNVLMGFTIVLADVNVHGNQQCITYFEDPDLNSV